MGNIIDNNMKHLGLFIILVILIGCNDSNGPAPNITKKEKKLPKVNLDSSQLLLYTKAVDKIIKSRAYSNLVENPADSSFLIQPYMAEFVLGVFSASDLDTFCKKLNFPLRSIKALEEEIIQQEKNYYPKLSEIGKFQKSHRIIALSRIKTDFLMAYSWRNNIVVDKDMLRIKKNMNGKEVAYFLFKFDKLNNIELALEEMAFYEEY